MEKLILLAIRWYEGDDNHDGSNGADEYSERCADEFDAELKAYAERHGECQYALFDTIMMKLVRGE